MSTTTVILRSPNKSDLRVDVAAPPTINGVRRAMADQDTSWDVAHVVGEEKGVGEEKAILVMVRDRPMERPHVRKVRLGQLWDEKDVQAAAISKLQQTVMGLQRALIFHQERSVANQEEFLADNTVWVDAADLVEKYECVALCLRGYNDFLFDLTRLPEGPGDRRMVQHEKEVLKREGLGYITRLIEPHKPLQPHIEDLRKRVLRMLTPRERQLCEALHERWKQERGARNHQQHPVPDRTTVVRRLGDLDLVDLDTLQKFLHSDPQRLPTENDLPDADLHLFAPEGTYQSVEAKVEKLRMKKAHKDADEQQLEFVKALQVL